MLKLGLPFAVRSKCMAGMCLTLSLKREHFAGVIENRCCGIFLGPCPLRVAKRAQRRRFFSNTHVARHEIGLLKWNIELRFISKLDCKHFAILMIRPIVLRRASFDGAQDRLRSRPTKFLQPEESSDAVLELDNEIAFGEFAKIDLRAMALGASQSPTAMCGQPSE